MKRLSDLEHAILGIVFKQSPCTTYTITREFSLSPSSHWRGSAGGVYPAVARLQKLNLLRSEETHRMGRSCSLLSLTSTGLATLRHWLEPPLPASAISITFDPLRTRAYFLSALTPTEQSAFLADAKRQLMGQMIQLEAEVERYRRSGDWFSEQAQRGALHLMRARIEWICQFQKALTQRHSKTAKRKVPSK